MSAFISQWYKENACSRSGYLPQCSHFCPYCYPHPLYTTFNSHGYVRITFMLLWVCDIYVLCWYRHELYTAAIFYDHFLYPKNGKFLKILKFHICEWHNFQPCFIYFSVIFLQHLLFDWSISNNNKWWSSTFQITQYFFLLSFTV